MAKEINNSSNYQDLVHPTDLLAFANNAPFGLILINNKKIEYVNNSIFEFAEKKYTTDFSSIHLIDFIYPDDRRRLAKLIDTIYEQKTVNNIYQFTVRGEHFNDNNRFFDLYITDSLTDYAHRIQIVVVDISDEIEKEKLLNQLAFESLMSIHKNEALAEVKKSLESLIDEKKYDKSDFEKIFKVLAPYENEEIEWGIFTNHFESLHPNFVRNLQLLFPTLTVNDIKHCACIRLSFNTKETAKFFNVTPSSVQTSRVRLKKKLNIDENVDLRDFILNI